MWSHAGGCQNMIPMPGAGSGILTTWKRAAVVPQVPPYRPGAFHQRELPPLRAVLEPPRRWTTYLV
jgi:hypothetical protein